MDATTNVAKVDLIRFSVLTQRLMQLKATKAVNRFNAARRFYFLLAMVLGLLAWRGQSRAGDLEADFHHPPEAAKPWVFWYWMNAAVSREGITEDLEAMKADG